MINFKLNKRHWNKINASSTYLKNFSRAVLNYDANRREDEGHGVHGLTRIKVRITD